MELEEALERFLQGIRPVTDTVRLPLEEAQGRVLAADVFAEEPVPSFARSAMDGYAVCAGALAAAGRDTPVELWVAGLQLAGDAREFPADGRTCVRVMTGAYIPAGFDAVIRQEDTDYGAETVKIYAAVKPGQNISPVGEDLPKGALAVRAGTKLSPLHLGVLASLGMDSVEVRRPWRVAILSTGSELTAPGQEKGTGKIYDSLTAIISSCVRQQGLEVCSREMCGDEEGQMREALFRAVRGAEFVITVGAVSVGVRDILPELLEQAGAAVLFRRVRIQPGTPTMGSVLWGVPVLSLSGNPFAAFANFEYYFWAAAAKAMGCPALAIQTGTATLGNQYPKINRHRRLLRARVERGVVRLPEKSGQLSSIIGNLSDCNCFVDLEAERKIELGDCVRIRYFKYTQG